MERKEALELAWDLVEKMGNAEDLNKRGYKIDGWKPMSGPERAEAVVKLAEFLVGQPGEESASPAPGSINAARLAAGLPPAPPMRPPA